LADELIHGCPLPAHRQRGGVGRIVRFTLLVDVSPEPAAEPAVGANCAALQRYAAVSQRRGINGDNALLPFTEDGAWLTEKLFGVIIYIALGFIALGRRRPRSQQSRFIAFLLALVVLFIIIQLAITRIPILG
jgi:hypothetical protein